MKRIILIMLALFMCRSMAIARDGTEYYYVKGEKHYINRANNDILVKFTRTVSMERYTFIINSLSSYGITIDKVFYYDGKLLLSEYLYFHLPRNNSEEVRKAMLAYPDVLYADQMFEDGLMGVSNEISVSLEPGNKDVCIEAIRKAGCKIIAEKYRLPEYTYYTVSCPKDMDVISKANELYETGLFRHAQPSFYMPKMSSTNDTWWNTQWNMYNTGQTGGSNGADVKIGVAHSMITKGNPNIKIAIIDQGTELTHSDLAGNLLPGYDALYGTSAGANGPGDDHGTACAGLAAGIGENNIGITGVAPGCKMIPVRIMDGIGGGWAPAADGIMWAADPLKGNADVLSCSWGANVQYFYDQDVVDAIDYAASSGRGGLGCVMAFATGNGNPYTHVAYNSLSFPSDRWNVIGVGATDKNDVITTYSNYGTGIDIVAPGGYADITTPTLGNTYRFDFDGTSSATPHVAGAAALILSVNPCLTWGQVRDILIKSADKFPNLCHFNNVADPWHNKYGYGRLNTSRAVRLALDSDLSFNGIGGTDVSTTNMTSWTILGSCIVAAGTYYQVERHVVETTINYAYNENASFDVTSNGYSGANPNSGDYFATAVSVTPTQATFRTFVYFCEKNGVGATVNVWVPCAPGNVRFFAEAGESFQNQDLYFQNRTENGLVKNYKSTHPIHAGYSVTNAVAYGDYVLQANNNVEFKSKRYVDLQPGFRVDAANSNNVFLAQIGGMFNCSQYPNGLYRQQNNSNNVVFAPPTEYVWEEEPVAENALMTQKGYNIFPVPNNGTFSISFPSQQNWDIAVINVLGQEVFHSNVEASKTVIRLEETLPSGTYTVRINGPGTHHMEKITIIK